MARPTTTLKPPTLDECAERIKAKKISPGSLASMMLAIKYSAAKFGIFNFPADADFYRANLYCEDKLARRIVLERIRKLQKKGGRVLGIEGQKEAEKIYRKTYKNWITSSEAKGLKNHKEIRRQMSHYENPSEIEQLRRKTPFGTTTDSSETPFDEPPKKKVKKAVK